MCHPTVPLLLGAGVDLVHLWLIRGGTDKKHGFLLVGHLPDNKLLKRDHRRLVVLGGGRAFLELLVLGIPLRITQFLLMQETVKCAHVPLWQIHIADPSLVARARHQTGALQGYLSGPKSHITPSDVSLGGCK